jgi:2-polyprenyl-3-methyl-5-hydroxy-6-metoxy-1,4-benzoquinol methylase
MSTETAPLACWCGAERYVVQFRTSRFGLLRCSGCGCFQINPPAIRADQDSGDFYTSYYNSRDPQASGDTPPFQGSTAPASRTSRFWRVAAQYPVLDAAGETVVDVGCGDGLLCGELLQAGWTRVLGIDVAQGRIEHARGLYPSASFHCGSIDECGVGPASVDLAIMDNVIEHLPAPRAFLESLHRYVKPGGRTVLITPNMESGNYRLLGRRWTPELAPHAHLFLFTRASLTRLLERTGFAVDMSGTFAPPSPYGRESIRAAASGHLKVCIWSAAQAAGDVYARAIGQGGMVFASGRKGRKGERKGEAGTI